MDKNNEDQEKRLLSAMSAQGVFTELGWILGSPSIVLTYLAISNELPVFLAAVLPTARRVGNMIIDVILGKCGAKVIDNSINLIASHALIGASILGSFLVIIEIDPEYAPFLLIFVVILLGSSEEVRTITYNNFIGDALKSRNRIKLQYRILALAGIIAAVLAWPIHQAMIDYYPATRHAVLIVLAATSFSISAYLIIHAIRFVAATAPSSGNRITSPLSAQSRHEGLLTNFRKLFAKHWFRKFMLVSLLLEPIELLLAFFAILAASQHMDSSQGLFMLVVSAGLAVAVSGPLWRPFAIRSHGLVMLLSCLLVAGSGSLLVANQFLQFVESIALYAFVIFAVRVGVQGVIAARTLYFLDVAPQADRAVALATTKYVVSAAAIVITIALAALAHVHHPVWPILFVVCICLLTAIATYRLTTKASGNGADAADALEHPAFR